MSQTQSSQSKRTINPAIQQSINPKKPKHWTLGLQHAMKDSENIVKSNDKVVVIRDKYPKAKLHYLVLPNEDISSIHSLNTTHISLIQEFGHMFNEIKETESYELRAGFHAVPSMHGLHMHIISKDMVSPSMKTKIHWNSFTTDFFLPYEDVLKELKENGSIQKMSKITHSMLISTNLKCNQCSFEPRNMPQLKEHLLSHCK